jgi:hypothetical protein
VIEERGAEAGAEAGTGTGGVDAAGAAAGTGIDVGMIVMTGETAGTAAAGAEAEKRVIEGVSVPQPNSTALLLSDSFLSSPCNLGGAAQ